MLYVSNSPADSIDPFGFFKKGRGYYTPDETIPNRFRVIDGGGNNVGGSLKGSGRIPQTPTSPALNRSPVRYPAPLPRANPLGIIHPLLGGAAPQNSGDFSDQSDQYDLNQRSFTEDQRRLLEDDPYYRSQRGNLKIDEEGKCGCLAGAVPRIPNIPNKDWYKYATQVSGTKDDYAVVPRNATGVVFDGLDTKQKRLVWEAKYGLGVIFYQGLNPKFVAAKENYLKNIPIQLMNEARVAKICKFSFKVAFSEKGVADYFKKELPYLDINHIKYK